VTRIRQFRIARDREINVARRPPQNLFNSIDPRRTWDRWRDDSRPLDSERFRSSPRTG
jgi:hypothetical protein